jgi:2-haloacid dehalogenase
MDIEIVAFDVFGTLVDWHTSVAGALAEVGGRAGIEADWPAVANAWRELYHPTLDRVVSGGLPYQSLDGLHRMMLDQVAEERGLGALTDADRSELVRAWHRLAPWPDSVPGLTALRERHLLSPLSNGGPVRRAAVRLHRVGRAGPVLQAGPAGVPADSGVFRYRARAGADGGLPPQ